MNIQGTLTNEAVLNDPETIEWMGSRKDSDDGPNKVRIFGHTEDIAWLKRLVEVQIGKSLPGPVIQGLELRLQRKLIKTKNAVERAQQRNRERTQRQ
ncbi:Uncharacterised protein [Mycobacteroides abscessus subsp. massiliense]|uniref:hypothetical protein n=1 Tax=Mycobacteroides abscessus TaxID=36809 RepID=UPI0009A7D4E9|nr:hypothetical protein [Mycobacteroides abscessus]SKY04006.1 Uncharacterised protein [Mycobacteroides abscessus subsp. massiliense]SKZ06381.1 Uncharacterised protein [Mycobacteroides abscessus subsp. massiliense]